MRSRRRIPGRRRFGYSRWCSEFRRCCWRPARWSPTGARAAAGGAILPRGRHGGVGLPLPSLEFLRTCSFFGWLLGVLAVTILLGQHVSLPLFMALYLVVWGGYRWPFAIGYAAAGLLLMVLLFDYLSPTQWYPALLLR